MSEIPHQPMDYVDLTGKTIGGYTIIRRLGRGGMADVYLARQESLERNVALKVLKPDLARDTSYIERFKREAQSAAKLVQSNIVAVYEVGQIEGIHFIAQEYVVGRNLREYLARNGSAKPVMAINVLRQVTLALQKAEQNHIIHRDIKPENIMLSPNGEVKVADFGLARVSDDSSKKHLTQIGITMGTPLYMSPEQVEGKPVDVRSDIYSLGVTTYHMLSGAPPFDGDNALSIAIQHVKNEALPLDEIRPDLPKPLIELVQQMMAKNPADRPSSASQLLKQIKQIKIASDEDWEQLVETLAIGSSTTKFNGGKTETRLAATRNLQNVMSGHIESWWMHRITLLSFVLLTLIGIATGYAFSKSFPIEDPLGVPIAIENSIPRRDNAKEQYELAIDLHPKDLESYKAVLNYHPVEGDTESKNQTKLYRDRSIERMAEIHLLASDFKKAQVLYSQLAANGYNTRFVIVGKAGLAVVNFHLGDHDKARDLVMQVESDAEKYLNQFLLQRFNSVRENYFANGSAVSLSN